METEATHELMDGLMRLATIAEGLNAEERQDFMSRTITMELPADVLALVLTTITAPKEIKAVASRCLF